MVLYFIFLEKLIILKKFNTVNIWQMQLSLKIYFWLGRVLLNASSRTSTVLSTVIYYYYFTCRIQIWAFWFASILSSCIVGWKSIFGVKFKPWVVQLVQLFSHNPFSNAPHLIISNANVDSYNTTFNTLNTLVRYDYGKKKKKSI